jgi:hypothetical protein
MEASARRILVVANRTAATPTLLDEVKRRSQHGLTSFALLIPDAPSKEHADWTLELALPLLERSAGSPVQGLTSEGDDVIAAIRSVVQGGQFDEIIISTLPKHKSKWLRRGLIHRIERLGLPVTRVIPTQKSLRDTIEDSDDVTRSLGML